MAGKLQSWYNKYIWEARSVNLENPKTPLNGWSLDQVFGGNTSGSGRTISVEGAMSLSAVYRAVAIKSGLISSLPFKVYQKDVKGRIEAVNHPASKLLSTRPNSKMSKVIYFDRAMQHYELYGNHFARIIRNGIGRVERLDLLHPDDVTVKETDSKLIYDVKNIGVVDAEDMIHVPNMGSQVVGKSVIRYMREDAALMMGVREYGSSFFERGGKPAGLLMPKAAVTPAQRQEMKKSFSEAKGHGGEVAMPYGWDYKEISVPPSDAEWVTTNDFSISVISRWFGVPTQKLGDSKVKYSNVEYMAIEFLQDTVVPIATKFECEYTNKLFQLPSEETLYVEMNLDAYLRADSATKSEQFSKYIQNAIKTPNEIRKYNNDPSIEGGDELFIQGATVPLSLQKDLYNKTPSSNVRILKKKVRKQVIDGMDSQLILEGILGNDGKEY
jgi:HK97 family phage portal protein